MNLVSPTDIRALITGLGIRPSKAKGQNFLIDRNILDIILDAAGIVAEDKVLEIGPGLGVLTTELIKRVSHVMAVEIDDRLFEYLADTLGTRPGLELVHADIMSLDLHEIAGRVTKVVANLPYSVGSRVLMDLVTAPAPPRKIVVTVQLEVAERLAAKPGTGDYGIMAVWSQRAYAVSIRKKVSNRCFLPNPDVSSAIVEMSLLPGGAVPVADPGLFHDLTKYAFAHRRKQLAGILGAAKGRMNVPAETVRSILVKMGADPRARPEQLSVSGWCDLANILTRGMSKA